MIRTVTREELAATCTRLRERVKTLRTSPRGGVIYRATLEDLQQLAGEAVLMHCPTATSLGMLSAGVALMEARLTLEDHTS